MTTDLFLWMAEAATRTMLVAAVAALILGASGVRDAGIRSAVWTAVLAAGLAMPFCLRVSPPVYAPSPAQLQVELVSAAPGEGAAGWSWPDAAGAVYAGVALMLLGRLGIGLLLGLRLRRRSVPAPELGANVRQSDEVEVPATFGVVHPFIVLPAGWRNWEPRKLEAVLLHEAAHIARGDFLVQLAAGVHAAVFWFSPLAWWVRRQLAALAEQAADDRVLSRAVDREFYAGVVLSFLGRRETAVPVVAMARESAAGKRIERILRNGCVPRQLGPMTVAGIAGIAASALYLASAVSFAQAPAAPPAPPAPQAPPARPAPAPPIPPRPPAGDFGALDIDDSEIRFRRGGKRYVITDKRTVDEARGFFAPMKELGAQQRALGAQQRALGEKMRAVTVRPPDLDNELEKIRAAAKQLRSKSSARQEDIGELQHMLGELQHKIGELQHQAGSQHAEVGRAMAALGQKQAELGARQAELGQKGNAQLKALIEQALKDGRAVPEPR
ncbi:MAG: M56 family metallopeptidase [Bryobacteraceae bacterium]|nr:M56 family metallopeptidase [Bryobacteraceae bacterium]